MRTEVDGAPVDDVGQLPDGQTFQGVIEMAQLLADSGQYGTCLTQKLMSYGLGRSVTPGDACVVSAIAEATVTPEGRFSDLLWAVVTSDAFLMQQGAP